MAVARPILISGLQTRLIWWLRPIRVIWPFLMFGLVIICSWSALREIHTRDFRTALHALDTGWLLLATALTAANIGVMGLYDVIAFRHTRSSAFERWRFGAVAFAWSNFLTLGRWLGRRFGSGSIRPASIIFPS